MYVWDFGVGLVLQRNAASFWRESDFLPVFSWIYGGDFLDYQGLAIRRRHDFCRHSTDFESSSYEGARSSQFFGGDGRGET
jgi:hypothetical protein